MLPPSIQALQSKDSYFDVPNSEQLRSIENNPHHWRETDLLQLKQFQHQFSQNITLNEQTIPQIRIYSLFLRFFFDSTIN